MAAIMPSTATTIINSATERPGLFLFRSTMLIRGQEYVLSPVILLVLLLSTCEVKHFSSSPTYGTIPRRKQEKGVDFLR